MVKFVQTSAARTLTSLLLLNRYLPQPNRRNPSEKMTRFGKEAMSYIAAAIEESFRSRAVDAIGNSSFGQDDVVEVSPALQGMVVQIISFLETDQFDDTEDENMEGGENEGGQSSPDDDDKPRPPGGFVGTGSGGTGDAAELDLPVAGIASTSATTTSPRVSPDQEMRADESEQPHMSDQGFKGVDAKGSKRQDRRRRRLKRSPCRAGATGIVAALTPVLVVYVAS